MSTVVTVPPTALTRVVVRDGTSATVVVRGGSSVIARAVGYPGPQGPAGAAGYVHTQLVPSSAWLVTHGLGFFPSVEVRSAGGAVIGADVQHLSVTQSLITHGIAVTGTARFT